MKIQKGHYVPKELITSAAAHEAVVKCFVAAGFERLGISGYGADIGAGEIGVGTRHEGGCMDQPLTIQQLFTAENGLQWPSFATEIRTDDNAVWFFGGGQAEHICGSIQPIPHRVLATRQPKENEVKTIEDAVVAKSGKWDSSKEYIQWCGDDLGWRFHDVNELWQRNEYTHFYRGAFIDYAKLLGYISGYRWGVEYPTNGKRPDLAKDTRVSCKIGGEWDYDDDYSDEVDYWNWPKVQAFKVLDQRFKPADTSYLHASTKTQNLTHSEEGLAHSDSVKNPKHYQVIEGVESITIIASAMTVEQWHGFCLGNILKYRIRAGKKGELQQDIAKADYYQELYEMHKHLCRDAK